MQTKKKLPGRNSTRELPSPKVCKPQKKVTDNTQISDKKVADIITSSARKQRFVKLAAGIPSKTSIEPVEPNQLNTNNFLAREEAQNICSGFDAGNMNGLDHKDCNDGIAPRADTLFSPSFHISKEVDGDIADHVDFMKYFQNEDDNNLQGSCNDMDIDSNMSFRRSDVQNSSGDMSLEMNGVSAHCNEVLSGSNLSSEVSAIYLAMQHSKEEYINDPSQESISEEVCVETEDGDEVDDFDPYLFIKHLPHLSSVVPTFRPMLLPKRTRSCPPTTLVLDLDETLVHSTLEHCDDADFTFTVNFNMKKHTVYVRCRPYLKDFMERVANLFEIIIFTASQSIYAEQLLNVLDPKRRIFRHRVFRESCVLVDGNYLKDLSVLGRDLAHVIIIDNSPQAFGFQVDNGIPIESWFDDRSDQELLSLLPFLESLVGVEDVRPLIAEKFNLRAKIAAAIYPSHFNRGDPFER
ncbi:hypothetical protein MKW92_038273 [Papaver armeniacum]|nr:hypothetical protein MKW92_038273 [Papaver armeniacum]